MRYCPNCGNEISTSDKFCSSCGHKLEGRSSGANVDGDIGRDFVYAGRDYVTVDGLGQEIECYKCRGDGYIATYKKCDKCTGEGVTLTMTTDLLVIKEYLVYPCFSCQRKFSLPNQLLEGFGKLYLPVGKQLEGKDLVTSIFNFASGFTAIFGGLSIKEQMLQLRILPAGVDFLDNVKFSGKGFNAHLSETIINKIVKHRINVGMGLGWIAIDKMECNVCHGYGKTRV